MIQHGDNVCPHYAGKAAGRLCNQLCLPDSFAMRQSIPGRSQSRIRLLEPWCDTAQYYLSLLVIIFERRIPRTKSMRARRDAQRIGKMAEGRFGLLNGGFAVNQHHRRLGLSQTIG